MPWRGPEVPGEFPTLGHAAVEWIEAHCVVPDGDRMGEPFLLTDEMVRFLLGFYRVRPDAEAGGKPGAAWHHARGGVLVRPQKWGKGPFSAAVILWEAEGDARFDGWDATGEPVGRPVPTPWIQITAVSEDQTANVYRALRPMVQLGPLADVLPSTGETRIPLRGGGQIETTTSEGTSRLGQRLTFALQDEGHSWLERNGGRRLGETQRRNLAGMGGRFLGTTNAWNPVEQSDVQIVCENPVGVLVDYPPPPSGSVRNKRERRKVLRFVYGDSASADGWVDLDRIDAEVEALIGHDPAQAERFFLNRTHAGESVAVPPDVWAARARPGLVVADGSLIVVGVDGARFDDALAIVATDVVTGHQWPAAVIERPPEAGDDYEHPLELADGAMVDLFERFSVWRAYIDPQRIPHLVNRWQGRWTDKVVVEWYTNRPKPVAWAVRNWVVAVSSGDMTHDGDDTFARHVGNARRQPLLVRDGDGRPMWTMRKERPMSPLKMDAAMAAVLAWEARGDAIAAGAELPKKKSKTLAFLR